MASAVASARPVTYCCGVSETEYDGDEARIPLDRMLCCALRWESDQGVRWQVPYRWWIEDAGGNPVDVAIHPMYDADKKALEEFVAMRSLQKGSAR